MGSVLASVLITAFVVVLFNVVSDVLTAVWVRVLDSGGITGPSPPSLFLEGM